MKEKIPRKFLSRKKENYAPKGNRTPVLALRGPCPGPLDDGGVQGGIVACAITAVNYYQFISIFGNFLLVLDEKRWKFFLKDYPCPARAIIMLSILFFEGNGIDELLEKTLEIGLEGI